MQRFEDKRILITGGTSGIGKATAQRLAEEGAQLLLTGHSEEHIASARDDVPGARVIANDASDPAAVDELVAAVRDFAPGGLDGVYLNAGYGSFRDFDAIDREHIDRHYELDLRGPILQARALAETIGDGGKLLLTGSSTVGGAREDTMVYTAMKAAIRQAARSLATVFAERQICVNVVTPGLTDTHFHTRGGMDDADQKTYRDSMADKVPLGRIGRPEDIAGVACFLLSDDADYVSGAELRVDGGLTML